MHVDTDTQDTDISSSGLTEKTLALPALPAISALLAACGGGGDSASTGGGTANPGTGSENPTPQPPVQPPASLPTAKEATKFAGQSLFAPSLANATAITQSGYSTWLEEQFALPLGTTRKQWLIDSGFNTSANQNNQSGFDQAMWMKLLSSPDQLRQRMTLALSEIFVLSIDGLPMTFKQFAAANYMDILEANAFGNYRTLLGEISTNVAMGVYLTFRGNQKANAARKSVPDENYAREIMQLFTIGLYALNPDGSLRLANGKPIETYDQDDITNLARVFTGWDYANTVNTTPDRSSLPMTLNASRHSPEAKTFLNFTIAANTDGITSMKLALDHLFNHPNVGPFIGRQLIQRFVSSNPSAAYVQRVASVFDNNGSGVRGDLKATLTAVLSDVDAVTASSSPSGGKLKEPLLRFIQWARTFGVASNAAAANDQFKIGNTSDPATRLGQSPGRSPSVFNFFRPGYIPPASALGAAQITAPEFQITHESSVTGYLNFMQGAIINGVGDMKPNYSTWLSKTGDVPALISELNQLLATGSLSTDTLSKISTAVSTLANNTDADKTKRVQAAIFLVMASPEYLVNR